MPSTLALLFSALAASVTSSHVVGGASGSSPAFSKSALLYIRPSVSVTCGTPYVAPS